MGEQIGTTCSDNILNLTLGNLTKSATAHIPHLNHLLRQYIKPDTRELTKSATAHIPHLNHLLRQHIKPDTRELN